MHLPKNLRQHGDSEGINTYVQPQNYNKMNCVQNALSEYYQKSINLKNF